MLQTENYCNLLITRLWTGPSGISSGLTSVLSQKIMRIAVLSMLKKSFCLRLAFQFKCLVFFTASFVSIKIALLSRLIWRRVTQALNYSLLINLLLWLFLRRENNKQNRARVNYSLSLCILATWLRKPNSFNEYLLNTLRRILLVTSRGRWDFFRCSLFWMSIYSCNHSLQNNNLVFNICLYSWMLLFSP